jgi:hypothetical protein
LIIDALADYAKITGIDLSCNNPFAAMLEQSIPLRPSLNCSKNERRLLKNIAMAIGD